MIIDCDVALVNTRCADRVRYCRGKVGVANDHHGHPVLVVITASNKEKFRIVGNCAVRSSTISFVAPKKDVYLKGCDELQIRTILTLIKKILRKELTTRLPNASAVEKMKPKPISLIIKDNNYTAAELSNKCLQKLHCDGLRLVPRLIWKLNNLHELKLNNCDLTDIPVKVCDLAPRLRILDLSSNHIKSIDASFAVAMPRLTCLELSRNKLECVPYQIKAMTSLERLNLSHNQLTGLSSTLGLLPSLRYLDLSHNNLNSLPYSLIKNLTLHTRLNNLDIANNPLREKHEKASDVVKHSFPSLAHLSCAAILSNDKLLYNCHKYLPNSLHTMIANNAENCVICSRGLVDRRMKLQVTLQSLENTAVCLSTSPFPTFPNVPSIQYICHFCRVRGPYRIRFD